MISKQERCIKRCDQFVTASSKRCDACIYSCYLCNETRVSDHESHGFGSEWLNGTDRLLVIPVQRTYTTFRRLPVSSNYWNSHIRVQYTIDTTAQSLIMVGLVTGFIKAATDECSSVNPVNCWIAKMSWSLLRFNFLLSLYVVSYHRVVIEALLWHHAHPFSTHMDIICRLCLYR